METWRICAQRVQRKEENDPVSCDDDKKKILFVGYVRPTSQQTYPPFAVWFTFNKHSYAPIFPFSPKVGWKGQGFPHVQCQKIISGIQNTSEQPWTLLQQPQEGWPCFFIHIPLICRYHIELVLKLVPGSNLELITYNQNWLLHVTSTLAFFFTIDK